MYIQLHRGLSVPQSYNSICFFVRGVNGSSAWLREGLSSRQPLLGVPALMGAGQADIVWGLHDHIAYEL